MSTKIKSPTTSKGAGTITLKTTLPNLFLIAKHASIKRDRSKALNLLLNYHLPSALKHEEFWLDYLTPKHPDMERVARAIVFADNPSVVLLTTIIVTSQQESLQLIGWKKLIRLIRNTWTPLSPCLVEANLLPQRIHDDLPGYFLGKSHNPMRDLSTLFAHRPDFTNWERYFPYEYIGFGDIVLMYNLLVGKPTEHTYPEISLALCKDSVQSLTKRFRDGSYTPKVMNGICDFLRYPFKKNMQHDVESLYRALAIRVLNDTLPKDMEFDRSIRFSGIQEDYQQRLRSGQILDCLYHIAISPIATETLRRRAATIIEDRHELRHFRPNNLVLDLLKFHPHLFDRYFPQEKLDKLNVDALYRMAVKLRNSQPRLIATLETRSKSKSIINLIARLRK